MGLAGFCPEPALLGFPLAGLEGMKQPQGLDGLWRRVGLGALVGAASFLSCGS